MNDIRQYIGSVESRLLGRVFTYDDALHLVVGVDEETGLARCNRRGPKGLDTILMPAAEVILRLKFELEQQEQDQLDELG